MKKTNKQKLPFSLSLAALGVVYGDIGTSPLYALRESLSGLALNTLNILGVLSLIFWTLICLISVKYLIVLLRADNHGEGGILALLGLVKRSNTHTTILFFMAIMGAGLILGDGMLTPAISVLSAVEGLDIIISSPTSWALPVTAVILICLFSIQYLGTAKIGVVFGPIIFIWFVVLAIIGLPHIIKNPIVLKAINPYYAYFFFINLGWKGYALLGGIFLVATGAEALYADLGHFGKRPIRLSWFAVAMPALLLNYFGQGAFLLEHHAAIVNPFYLSAPITLLWPLLLLATIATIIASQAIISATYSVTRQAILLGLYPRLSIIQTSKQMEGQIYIPQMNTILLLGALFLILSFRSASALTHAYGIAVNIDMTMTTILALYVARKQWHWTFLLIPFFGLACIDFAFLGANIQKLLTGGWVPILLAIACAVVMYSWHEGRKTMRSTHYLKNETVNRMIQRLDLFSKTILPGATAVFITDIYDQSAGAFLHFLKLHRTQLEKQIIVRYVSENVPHVYGHDRFDVQLLKENICSLTLHYGFMDTIAIPAALHTANEKGLLPFPIDLKRLIYLIEIPNIVATKKNKSLWLYWRTKLFSFLVRNYSALRDIEFYHLPYNSTMGMGAYYVI